MTGPAGTALREARRADAAESRKWWVLLAVGVGTFVSALDGSVVNALLPTVPS